MKNLLADAGLREDLMSNEELHEQSEELLDVLLKMLSEKNITDVDSESFEPVHEILAGISIPAPGKGFRLKKPVFTCLV